MLATAIDPAGADTETANGVLYPGSSKQGKARRASVGSKCVNAYQRPPSATR
jgi:hypothetical protein